MSIQTFVEAMTNEYISALLNKSEYALAYIDAKKIAVASKQSKPIMEYLIERADLIDEIRNNENSRALFNKNRIRLLAPGDVSWTVPEDWPTDFVHIQLVGGGGQGSCGTYTQFVLNVSPGDILTGNIGSPGGSNAVAGDVTFAGVIAAAGGNSAQSGSFLVKASSGSRGGSTGGSSTVYGGAGGFEGGSGGQGYSSSNGVPGTGDGTLGECEGTGGAKSSGSVGSPQAGENGGGGGHCSGTSSSIGGGGGYGGGGARNGTVYGGGGSGAIVISCPDGYIPEFVVWNTIDGVTEWRRDENIFNDFVETA